MWDILIRLWPVLLAVVGLLAALAASAHAVMYRRDTRAVVAWVGLIWLSPILGPVLYVCLGINRIRRRGHKLSLAEIRSEDMVAQSGEDVARCESAALESRPNMLGQVRLVGQLTQRPVLSGNQVQPLVDGDETYPAMLAAIEAAERSVAMSTYIFDNDRVGKQFADALEAAHKRGVDVRVMIDDVGARYTKPTMLRELKARDLHVEGFLPSRVPRLFHYANLRNHRKILVVDGRVGFTGGTNIREGHQLSLDTHHPVQDVHFRIEGPVVAHLLEAFAVDWEFSAGESLEGDAWRCDAAPCGDTWARGISDGPDEDFEKLQLTIQGALTAATEKVHVVTPYFLPDASLISALNVAAMRGVEVDIVLPAENNIKLVQWATSAMLWQLLERGCRVWYSPAPFDHTKLVLVDGIWSLFGSTNWDPRSLRLNFEFNVECYDPNLTGTLAELVDEKIARSRRVTLDDVDGRSVPIRLRDGTARLLSPYL